MNVPIYDTVRNSLIIGIYTLTIKTFETQALEREKKKEREKEKSPILDSILIYCSHDQCLAGSEVVLRSTGPRHERARVAIPADSYLFPH